MTFFFRLETLLICVPILNLSFGRLKHIDKYNASHTKICKRIITDPSIRDHCICILVYLVFRFMLKLPVDQSRVSLQNRQQVLDGGRRCKQNMPGLIDPK